MFTKLVFTAVMLAVTGTALAHRVSALDKSVALPDRAC